MNRFSLWPQAASEQAARVDLLFIGLLVISGAILLLVAGLLLVFCLRYRRGSSAPRGLLPGFLRRDVEIGWTTGTLFLALFLFWWAGATQLRAKDPPAGALEIHVAAKQWMWKARHPNGAREINALHVPRGEAVRLVMTSQDVIHSFFVPAFRLKQDVIPGRFTEMWFRATEPGEYRLFCAEFCGTDHARMGGTVTVMQPEDYARWAAAQPQEENLAEEGARLFTALGCSGCHAPASAVHAPLLAGAYGRMVHLADGRTIRADEAYIRDSILQPKRDVVAGFEPIMPSFEGLVDQGDLQRLVAYVQSLRGEAAR
ncbi:cytochrome c oxidase subunit II [Siccirubricoccus sp. G192]|uniref:cytochrome c oxidase subunit II n=1 Tax=Siccirubricoccus sp. G192 TaxID=2849651 RepID=UPI001C2B890B|nr:cytochrome c oxidase subunit II [Siccirubricoccus sp. G192]MBV1795658.1 cytochrome c oxidase subunit II [Siccirubricoccus sp. G192]